MSSGTKVVVFLDVDEISTIDSICALTLGSRADAIRFLIATRRQADREWRSSRAKTTKPRKATPEPEPGDPT